ncbi:MAG: hypothetical protein MZV70_67230 [Desulfobacterales bacterium]|nr:hypothetical protein [Desulfobacterales bacterium]
MAFADEHRRGIPSEPEPCRFRPAGGCPGRPGTLARGGDQQPLERRQPPARAGRAFSAACRAIPRFRTARCAARPEVQAALEEFRGRNLNLIVVNSGDGTIQAALTVLCWGSGCSRAPPLLALLSGGTTNMTHQDLGLRGPPAEALRRVLNWAHHGEGEALIRRRTVLKVQTGSAARSALRAFFRGGLHLQRHPVLSLEGPSHGAAAATRRTC